MMTTHGGFERLIATAVDFRLAPRERSILDEHLAACPSCRAMALGYRADASALRDIAFASPPPRVRATILAAAARPVTWTIEPWKVLLAAALLLAALVGTTLAAGAFLRLLSGNPDPIDWSAVPAGPALVDNNGSLRLQGVASHAGRFVAVGSGPNGGIIVTSPDGRLWNRPIDPAFNPTSSVDVFGVDDGFQIVGSSNGNPAIWTSPDGIAWKAVALDDSLGAVRAVAAGGRHTILVGGRIVPGDTVAKGSAGVGSAWYRNGAGSWGQATIFGAAPSVEFTAVSWTGDRFIAMAGSEILSSPDGVIWRHVSAALPIGATTLVAGRDRIIAAGLAGDAPAVWTSGDGVAWTRASLPAGTTGRILAVADHAGSFVAVGSGPAGVATWYSSDGVSWTAARPIDGGSGGLMLDVAWGRDVVVGVGALGSRAAIWSGREARR
jgi:hypothetical protein